MQQLTKRKWLWAAIGLFVAILIISLAVEPAWLTSPLMFVTMIGLIAVGAFGFVSRLRAVAKKSTEPPPPIVTTPVNQHFYNYAPQPTEGTVNSSLPTRRPFFGREAQLETIANALSDEVRGWGVLIDGVGGIGKTALAIEAGHCASDEQFERKLFLSAKNRELTPKGERELADFQLPNYLTLLKELALELGATEIAKSDPNERANEVRRALVGKQALLIIDNLETFDALERDRVIQLLERIHAVDQIECVNSVLRWRIRV